jgi:hypothetical protein
MSQFESVQYFSGVSGVCSPSHVIRLPYAFYVMGVQRATTAILDVGRESLVSAPAIPCPNSESECEKQLHQGHRNVWCTSTARV